jgi:PAS domain S-box-containing protein
MMDMDFTLTADHIFNSTSNGFIVTDANGTIAMINNQAAKILELEKTSVIDSQIIDILPLTGALIEKCLKNREPLLGCQIQEKNASLVINITLITVNDKILGTVCNFQHLEQFEKLAQQLDSYKRLCRQLTTIFNTSQDLIWLYDGEGRIVNINESTQKIRNIRPEDIVGKKYSEIIDMGIIDRSIVPEVLKTRQQVSILDNIIKGKSTALVTGTPIFNDYKEIELIVVTSRNMTELNKIQMQLEENQKLTDKYREELTELRLLNLKKKNFIAESQEMQQILNSALKLAKSGASNILLLGDSGTGKNLLAEFIHQTSHRHKKPFIQINCAAIPEGLIEAELFGYEKGAFTGASKYGKAGLFELADEGTLFLDEIGDLPLALQSKLLKCIDDHMIMRIGGNTAKKIDCTIIAATNKNLELLVRRKKFRGDLYFRLNIFSLKIPSLNQRREDVLALVKHFLEKFNKEYRKSHRITAKGLELLNSYSFPGNVRELKNIIEKAVVLSEAEELDQYIFQSLGRWDLINEQLTYKEKVESFEKEILSQALLQFKTSRAMAKHLHLNQSSIVRKLKKYKISKI